MRGALNSLPRPYGLFGAPSAIEIGRCAGAVQHILNEEFALGHDERAAPRCGLRTTKGTTCAYCGNLIHLVKLWMWHHFFQSGLGMLWVRLREPRPIRVLSESLTVAPRVRLFGEIFGGPTVTISGSRFAASVKITLIHSDNVWFARVAAASKSARSFEVARNLMTVSMWLQMGLCGYNAMGERNALFGE